MSVKRANQPNEPFGCGMTAGEAGDLSKIILSLLDSLELCDYCKLNLLGSISSHVIGQRLKCADAMNAFDEYQANVALLIRECTGKG